MLDTKKVEAATKEIYTISGPKVDSEGPQKDDSDSADDENGAAGDGNKTKKKKNKAKKTAADKTMGTTERIEIPIKLKKRTKFSKVSRKGQNQNYWLYYDKSTIFSINENATGTIN